MKKFLVLFLAATMVLSLTSCGKKAKLYEKYSELITEMENGEFDQAMSTVAEIASEPNDKYSSQVVEYIYTDLYFYNAE